MKHSLLALRNRSLPALFLTLTALVPLPSRAGQGVIEISQAEVAAAGGFPFLISSPGSYRLTSDLQAPADTGALLIATSPVSLDLAGHVIAGPNSCTYASGAVTCTLTGLGNGIWVLPSAGGPVSIRKGTIRGFEDNGIYCSSPCLLSDLEVEENASQGIRLDGYGAPGELPSGILTRVTSQRNRYLGIYAQGPVTLRESLARHNGSEGFTAQQTALVTDSSLLENGGTGTRLAGAGSLVAQTVIAGNGNKGIDTTTTLSARGLSIRQTTVRSNVSFGIDLDTLGGLSGVVASGNATGDANPQIQGLVELGVNVCGTDTVCP